MKRISALLFCFFTLLITSTAQTPFQLDSLQYMEELRERPIPQLIEVRAEGQATLYASSTDTLKKISKMAEMPLFLLGDEGAYWACCYLGRIAYVRKSAAVNSAAIQEAYNRVSHHYRYLLAYNAVVQGLQLALEYTEQTQKALADGSIEEESAYKEFLNSKHRELSDALPYLDKVDPKAFFGQ